MLSVLSYIALFSIMIESIQSHVSRPTDCEADDSTATPLCRLFIDIKSNIDLCSSQSHSLQLGMQNFPLNVDQNATL